MKDRIEAAARVMSKENVTLAGTEKKNLEAMVKKLENLPTSSKKKANKKSKHSSEGYYSKFMEEAKQFDIFSILEKVEKHVEGSKVIYCYACISSDTWVLPMLSLDRDISELWSKFKMFTIYGIVWQFFLFKNLHTFKVVYWPEILDNNLFYILKRIYINMVILGAEVEHYYWYKVSKWNYCLTPNKWKNGVHKNVLIIKINKSEPTLGFKPLQPQLDQCELFLFVYQSL